MKTLLTSILILISLNSFSQYGHKESIKEKHIDLKTTYIYFEVKGLVECNGHTWLNDTCKVPLIYKADKEGIEFSKGKIKYAWRDCGHNDCEILHLNVIESIEIGFSQPWGNGIYLTPIEDLLIQDTINF